MPLLNAKFPPNAIIFYSFVKDISNFDILPMDWVKENIYSLTSTKANEIFTANGYESLSFIDNIGSMIVHIIGFFIVSSLTLSLSFFKEKD
jgi:hypothetical protein